MNNKESSKLSTITTTRWHHCFVSSRRTDSGINYLLILVLIGLINLYILPQHYSFPLLMKTDTKPLTLFRNTKLVPETIINGNPIIVKGTGQKLFIIQVNGTVSNDRELRFSITIMKPTNLTRENFRVILSSDPAVSEDDLMRFPLLVAFNDGKFETSVIFTYSPFFPRPIFYVVVESQLPAGVEGRILFQYKVGNYDGLGDLESLIFPLLLICGLMILVVLLGTCFWGMVKKLRDRSRVISEKIMEFEGNSQTQVRSVGGHRQQAPPPNVNTRVHIRQETEGNQELNTRNNSRSPPPHNPPPHNPPPSYQSSAKQDDTSTNMRPEGIVDIKQPSTKPQPVDLQTENDAVTYIRLDGQPILEQQATQEENIQLSPQQESINYSPLLVVNQTTMDAPNQILIPPPIFNPTPVAGHPGLFATTFTTTTILLPSGEVEQPVPHSLISSEPQVN